MNQFFKELFEYNHHSNQQLCALLQQHSEQTGEQAEKLFSHILNAHQIWNNRVLQRENAFTPWQIHPGNTLADTDRKNYEHSIQVLDTMNLDSSITYTNTSGQTFTNTVRDILFHIINHSTYHRAQIATAVKQNGLQPLATDYIFYKRK